MRGSISLGRLAGARLAVDATFLLLLAAAAVLGFPVQVLIVAASLASHELAHLLAAWGAAVEVTEVQVTPFGGVAHLSDSLALEPAAEVAVALAGPCNSLALATLAAMLGRWSFWDRRLLEFCFQCNAGLAFFNLLPALPLDGGRALRGLLCRRWGYGPVTRLLTRSGRVCGAGLTAASLLALLLQGHLYLTPLVAGPYLWWFAGREEAEALYRTFRLFLRRQQTVARQVLPERRLVAPGTATLRDVLPRLVAHSYHVVVVVGDDLQPLGTLSEADLQAAFRRLGPQVRLVELLAPPGG